MVYMISYTGLPENDTQTFDLERLIKRYKEWIVLNKYTYIISTDDSEEQVLKAIKVELRVPFRIFICKVEPPLCWYGFPNTNLSEWCNRVFQKNKD